MSLLGGATNIYFNLHGFSLSGSFCLGVEGSIVAELQKIDVLVGIVVEENGGAGLTLEVNAVLVLTWYL